MHSVYHQQGVVVLLPLILLLTAMAIFSQANAERTRRLQQSQTTMQAVNLAYAEAQRTAQQILVTLRTASASQLTEQLSVRGLEVAADTLLSPSGSPHTTYEIAFQQPVRTLSQPLTIAMQAVKYSALQHVPSATFLSTTLLPAGLHLSLWHSTTPATVKAGIAANAPPETILLCQQTRIPQCAPQQATRPAPSYDEVITTLFNRSAEQFSGNLFINTLETRECHSLAKDQKRVIWVSGNCQLTVKQSLGSTGLPVLLIIENGDLRLAKDATIVGLVLLLRRDSALPTSVVMAEGASVTGAIINTARLAPASSLRLIADDNVLTLLQSSDALAKITMIPGSWRDFE